MKRLTTIAVLGLLCTPLFAIAQDAGGPNPTTSATITTDYSFQRDGVFGCNVTGSYSMSVGALSATGGVFVPVNDAAVTLNTGYLVYKECVLRGIINRMKENQTSLFDRSIINAYTRGRQGLPLFLQNQFLEGNNVRDETIVSAVQGTFLDGLNPAFKSPVSHAIVTSYMTARNKPQEAFGCPFTQQELADALASRPTTNYWDTIGNFSMYPGCNYNGAYTVANRTVLGAASANWNSKMMQLLFGNGTYPVVTYDADGNEIIVTPSSIVAANALQAIQSGYRQLENANDIDQIVGALFSGITTQVIADQNGLIGLTRGSGGLPSYLDRVVQESAQGLRNSLANSAIQILNAAKAVEERFLSAWNAVLQKLTATSNELRAKERACWDIVIPKVCATSVTYTASGPTCKGPQICHDDPNADPTANPKPQICVDGPTLNIATSTRFSDAAIANKITPLASSTATAVTASQNALNQLNELIAGVTNNDAVSQQRFALAQLDSMVHNRLLHNQYDAQNAEQTRDSVISSMDAYVCTSANCDIALSVVKQWADDPGTSVGWCNVQNNAVVTGWRSCWDPASNSGCPW